MQTHSLTADGLTTETRTVVWAEVESRPPGPVCCPEACGSVDRRSVAGWPSTRGFALAAAFLVLAWCSSATASSVVGWGSYGYSGRSANWVPDDLTNIDVVAVAAGNDQHVALGHDGTVTAWGTAWLGYWQNWVAPVTGLSNVVQLATGGYYVAALRTDGTVAFFNRSWYQAAPRFPIAAVEGLTNVQAIAVGYTHGLALLADSTVAGWGDNYNGQRDPLPASLGSWEWRQVLTIAWPSSVTAALSAGATTTTGKAPCQLALPMWWRSRRVTTAAPPLPPMVRSSGGGMSGLDSRRLTSPRVSRSRSGTEGCSACGRTGLLSGPGGPWTMHPA